MLEGIKNCRDYREKKQKRKKKLFKFQDKNISYIELYTYLQIIFDILLFLLNITNTETTVFHILFCIVKNNC